MTGFQEGVLAFLIYVRPEEKHEKSKVSFVKAQNLNVFNSQRIVLIVFREKPGVYLYWNNSDILRP